MQTRKASAVNRTTRATTRKEPTVKIVDDDERPTVKIVDDDEREM